ncbi:hypothetical protein [Pantoea sp. CCBC3-3-1]|uniref:hypothetical protein n=1 Tax=Pantoea sp. CCBC3-3-1 TaxID=2490851 RepID=UPI0011BF9C08|nr:hypothetical protein [Pantoea sp. CCBC3-3-1]
MTTINATYTSKDENFPDGATVYWFDVDSESYGVVIDKDGNSQVVDCDGTPTSDFTVDQFEITNEKISE